MCIYECLLPGEELKSCTFIACSLFLLTDKLQCKTKKSKGKSPLKNLKSNTLPGVSTSICSCALLWNSQWTSVWTEELKKVKAAVNEEVMGGVLIQWSIKQNWSYAYRDRALPPLTTASSVNERWQWLTIHYCKRPTFTFNHLVDAVIQSDLQMRKLTSNLSQEPTVLQYRVSKVNHSSRREKKVFFAYFCCYG